MFSFLNITNLLGQCQANKSLMFALIKFFMLPHTMTEYYLNINVILNNLLRMCFQFQTELRKILISLIEAAQKILELNSEASKIFKQAEGFIYFLKKILKSNFVLIISITVLFFWGRGGFLGMGRFGPKLSIWILSIESQFYM